MERMKSDFAEYLDQLKKNELEYNGIEADADSDCEGAETEEPYDIQNIRVEQKMITVFQIEHWISGKSGTKLNLSPEYQRNMVWDERRKSSLIESLLLRIPIPAFYLDEDSEGKKSVIDGMQRLTTIHAYLNNEFPLKRLQYLSHCEKKYFRDLEPKLQGRIEDTELAVNILDERCPQMVKFDVFRKVNTGGLPLNDQEIRNITAQPAVRTFLRNMASCEEFRQATREGVRDIRMGAQELCLRYLTIRAAYDWERRDFYQYHGLLKMMDQMILILNTMDGKQLNEKFEEFRRIMADCHKILGEDSFYKPGYNKINKSLFTGWAVVLANAGKQADSGKLDIKKLKELYRERLRHDVDFYNAITSSTGTRKHIVISINVIRELWEACYDQID